MRQRSKGKRSTGTGTGRGSGVEEGTGCPGCRCERVKGDGKCENAEAAKQDGWVAGWKGVRWLEKDEKNERG